MGKFRLFDEEELVARFRPHPVAYLPRYLAASSWILAGLVGAAAAQFFSANHAAAWGLVSLAVVGLAVGLTAGRLKRRRLRFPWFAALVAMTLVAFDVAAAVTWPIDQPIVPLALGSALAVVRLVGWESERLGRVQFLTTDRLVIRAGVGRREERTIQLKRILEVRSRHGVLGQAFDVGDLVLVLSRQVRGTEAKVFEETETLDGVGRMGELKHHIEQLVEETRLGIKDRRRRSDERRMKESMRSLQRWMRRRPGPGT